MLRKSLKPKYYEIDVVFLYYAKELAGSPPTMSIIETTKFDADGLKQATGTRFANTELDKMLCGRYCWYIHRMKKFLAQSPNKKLRVSHWNFRSGDRSMFMLDGVLYPNLAYTFDSYNEHWFFTRAKLGEQHVSMEWFSRDCTEESPLKAVFDKYRGRSPYSFDEFKYDIAKAYCRTTFEMLRCQRNEPKDVIITPKRKKAPSLYKICHKMCMRSKLKTTMDPEEQ